MVKDKKKRRLVEFYEKKRFILSILARNNNYSKFTKWNSFFSINKLPYNSSSIKLSNRCVITWNKKRLNKLSNFSRVVFLKFIREGKISGIKKSSW